MRMFMEKERKNLLSQIGRFAPSQSAKSNWITYAVIAAAFILVQILTASGNLSSLWKGLLVPLCTYVILAVSLNLTVGILGELSLGHAGFMCVGAFTGAFFSIFFEDAIPYAWLRFPLALIIGGLAAALFGAFIGVTVLRLRGDYLAIVTLAFGEIVKNIVNILYVGRDADGLHFSTESKLALHLKEGGEVLINGAQGISGTPKNSSFLIGIILVLVTVAVTLNLIHSRTGRAIMAIRDNRIAAESIGIDITKYKADGFCHLRVLRGHGRRAVRPQSLDAYSDPEELRVQHVDHHPGLRRTWRNRQHPGLNHRGRPPDGASGSPPPAQRLPHADLRHRPDPDDDPVRGSAYSGAPGKIFAQTPVQQEKNRKGEYLICLYSKRKISASPSAA